MIPTSAGVVVAIHRLYSPSRPAGSRLPRGGRGWPPGSVGDLLRRARRYETIATPVEQGPPWTRCPREEGADAVRDAPQLEAGPQQAANGRSAHEALPVAVSSGSEGRRRVLAGGVLARRRLRLRGFRLRADLRDRPHLERRLRSEEHTSEL